VWSILSDRILWWWGLSDFVGFCVWLSGAVKSVASHLSGKNKDAAKVGPLGVGAGTEKWLVEGCAFPGSSAAADEGPGAPIFLLELKVNRKSFCDGCRLGRLLFVMGVRRSNAYNSRDGGWSYAISVGALYG
jgi:hypothetical protein